MQKLKRNFVESKMNKDLDDRFVPPGEYRDALNISVITNTDSSSGAVQNSKGNNSISDLSKNIETKNVVNGAVTSSRTVVFDEANDDILVGSYLYSNSIFPNLLTNPSFDADTTGWTTQTDSGSNPWVWNSGGYAEKASGTANASLRQSISVVANKTYVGSFRKKFTGGSNTNAGRVRFYLDLNNDGTPTAVGDIIEQSGGWVTSTVEFTPTFTGSLLVMIYMHADGLGYIDDVSIKLKDTQPIVISISDDKKTITLNTPVTLADDEIVYTQYSKMLPNECVGAIEDEGGGSLYWMTSARDDDDSRQFNFRNSEQRSSVNLIPNPNFQQGTVGNLYTDGWNLEEAQNDLVISNPTIGDNYITLEHKAGSTAKYPGFSPFAPIKFEHGKRYKIKFNISAISSTGPAGYNPKIFLYGVTDPETGAKGVNPYRPIYVGTASDGLPATGDHEYYFVFDEHKNNRKLYNNPGSLEKTTESSYYLELRIELTQGLGGYQNTSYEQLITIGEFSITEHDADLAIYQDTIFEYKDETTNVVANDMYMIEAPSTAPHFTASANINTTPATFIHSSVTKDMTWQIVAKNDSSTGVPHIPFNPTTHAGIVSSVKSAELGLDPSFTSAGWATNDNSDSVGWPTNNTGVSGNGAGAIYWTSNNLYFNAVAVDKYIGGGNVNIVKGKTYIAKFNVTSLTAGKLRIIVYDQQKNYWASTSINTSGLYEYEFVGGSGGTGGVFDSSIAIQSKEAGTTATVASVEISDKFDLSVATLEPYSGTAVQFPDDNLNYKLVLTKPKVLDLNYNSKVTGINLVEKMLFWTDGYSEPKKINIDNCSVGTHSLHSQTMLHTPQNNTIVSKMNVYGGDADLVALDAPARTVSFHYPYFGHSDSVVKIKKEHVTVMRQAPHQPPLIDLSPYSGGLVDDFTVTRDMDVSGYGGGANAAYKRMIVGQPMWLGNVSVNAVDSSIKAGDILYCTQGASDAGLGYDIKFEVVEWYGSNDIKVTVLYINPNKTYEDTEIYYFKKASTAGIYEDKFVRFGYRYKYSDGEYSSFSPFSRPAFLPNNYNYDAIKGVNKGMVNKCTTIKIKGFVPQDIPADVVEVDLLYKDSDHSNVYKLKSFHTESPEWNALAYGDNKDRDDSHLAHNGIYEFTSDNLMGALPSSQLLRAWDAVPRRAVAQEVVGNRLVYGNYTQNYNIISSGRTADFTMEGQMVNVSGEIDSDGDYSEKALSSCKSLRSYQVGVVYGDYLGRETPILTSGSCAVESKNVPSNGRLLLQAKITSQAPSWAKYYRHYVKESSLPYHNLVLDRWWEAADDTLWLSFYSHDRNKLDVGDEIILKKKHGDNYVLNNPEKNKILAIENEAPDSCKLKTIRVATYNADTVAAIEGDDSSTANAAGTGFTEHGFYGMSTTQVLPEYPRTGDVNEGEDYFDIKDSAWETSGFAGLENSFAQLGPDETMVIMFRKSGLSSERYEVLNIQSPTTGGVPNVSSIFTDRYRITLDRELGPDAGNLVRTGRFSTASGVFDGLVVRTKVLIQAFVETYELEDYHEGRFFVKVDKTTDMVDYVMCNGRSVEQREVMEMRLPYLAHNANYYTDGTTGMSTTSPDQNPHASSVGTKSYVSRYVWNNMINSGATNGLVNNVTNGRKKATHEGYENGTTNTALTYADIEAGTPYSLASATTTGTFASTDLVMGGLHRSNSDWEDYFVRYSTWSNSSGLVDDFWFVDKEPTESDEIWYYTDPTNDPGLATQLSTWTPLYKASNGSTTATHASGLWTNTGSAEVPGPANNWTDNNPARFKQPTTLGGGVRTNFQPWMTARYGSYISNNYQRKSTHDFVNRSGYDYNNSDFANGYYSNGPGVGYSAYTSAGADVGRSHMTLSRGGIGNPRNDVFYDYIYTTTYGINSESTDEPYTERPTLYSPVKFYWREDPDKEIYTINKVYYGRVSHNYAYSQSGESTQKMNHRRRVFCYLDKPHGSGPSGWAPFYHPHVNPSGAIDAGFNWSQPLIPGTSQSVDEFRTMVILDSVLLGTAAAKVDNAAIFETVPKQSEDIDIYYESGGAIPISIDGLDPETFVPYIYVGSKIEIDYTTGGNPTVFTSTIGIIDKDGRLGLQDTVPDDVVLGDSVRIYKSDSDDAQYISSTVRVDPGSGFTSVYLSDTTGHGGWCGIPFVNCFNFQNGVESNVIKDLFNESRMSKGVIVSTSLDTVPKEENYKNTLIHSGIYNSKTGLNDFNQFIIADNITKDINPDYGSIQKLNTRDADMTVLCEDKIVRLLVNKNSLYNADGTTNVTASDLVLGQDVPYVGEYGISKNPESFVNYGYKSFFTDRNRGAVLRLSQDGLTTISKNGMESYFDKNLRGEGFLIGSYDAKKYEYNLTATLPKITLKAESSIEYTREITMESTVGIIIGMYVDGDNIQNGSRVVGINTTTNVIEIDKDTLSGGVTGDLDFEEKITVSFNDVSNGWSSFRSFIPEHGLSVRGEYFTYNNGTLYQHYTNDKANFFYNKYYGSSITAIFNDGPDVVKDFKILEYLGSVPKNKTTEYGWYISSAETDVESGYIGSFVEKEGKYLGYVKGFNTGYTDATQFTTQGIGNITKIENV